MKQPLRLRLIHQYGTVYVYEDQFGYRWTLGFKL